MLKKILLLVFIAFMCINARAQYAESILVETLLKTDTTFVGQPIAYPNVEKAEVTILKITINPGALTGWHKHGIPLFAYVMQGVLTVELGNGTRKQFRAGTAVAESRNTYHQGMNEGEVPVVLLAVYMGGDAQPLATPKK